MNSQTFDPIWEEKYASGHSQNYPWDAVVSFVFRNLPDKPKKEVRILEVGCGTASNLWFAAREGFYVAGVDGSPSAIAKAKQRFETEGLSADLRVADFITSLPFDDSSFDLAIDRSALVCVGLNNGRKAVNEIHRVLRPGGKFFFNPYSDRHSSAVAGNNGPDGLICSIMGGTLVDVGQICFYGRRQVLDALHGWKILSLQHMEFMEMLEPRRLIHAEWRVVAKKE